MRSFYKSAAVATAAMLMTSQVEAVTVDFNDPASIKSGASAIAQGLFSFYDPSQLGLLIAPYPSWNWWQAGAMMGTLVHYNYYTKDTTYNDKVAQAIISQASPTIDFMRSEINGTLGNDDQAFWAMTAMEAVEFNHPVPDGQPKDIYLQLAKNSFNDFKSRWGVNNTGSSCNGGIKWQIYSDRNGYYYKSTIANGAFFHLAGRLARYTGESVYFEWADKVYNWLVDHALITSDFQILDGTGDNYPRTCDQTDGHRWSYNPAVLLAGSAALAAASPAGSADASKWTDRVNGLWSNVQSTFLSPYPNATNVLYEQECEKSAKCGNDQVSFKAYLARWALYASKLVPSIAPGVNAMLSASAQAAAQSCTGNSGATCGTAWWASGFDGMWGVGPQMASLEVFQGVLGANIDLPAIPAHAVAPAPAPAPTTTTTQAPAPSSAASSAAPAPTTLATVAKLADSPAPTTAPAPAPAPAPAAPAAAPAAAAAVAQGVQSVASGKACWITDKGAVACPAPK